MKKTVLLCSSLLFITLSSYGQQIEVSAGYGTSSLYGVTDELVGAVSDALTNSENSTSSQGVFNVDVNLYSQSMKWRYGLDINYESFSTKGAIKQKYYLSFSPKIDYFWSPKENEFRFYSGLSAGVGWRNLKYINENSREETTENSSFFAFNFTPIGMRYGKDFGVFLEPNLGIKSFLLIGVSYVF